jgi:circadian clock protein KaiC
MDVWLLLRDLESGAERNRVLHLLKSRGMAHSNQVREFLLTSRGVELRDVYLGPSGALLTGSARVVLEAQEQAQALVHEQEASGRTRALERKRVALEAQIASLRAEFGVEEAELKREIAQGDACTATLAGDRVEMGRQRQDDAPASPTAETLH